MTADSGFQLADDGSARYERHIGVFMAPLVEALLDRAAPRPGDALLDVATGTGFVARRAIHRVGTTGSVDALDINAGMLAVAQAQAADDAPAISWHLGSAQELPFPASTFDVVVSQQGIQFFPDLHGAIAEMARVTRPGGVVAATAWAPMPTSPYMEAQYRALTELAGEDATASFLHAFSLTPDELTAAWTSAGLGNVQVTEHIATVTLPPLRTYAQDQLSATPWGAVFAESGPEGRAAFLDRVVELLDGHTHDGVTTVPFGTHIVSGTA